MLFESQIKQYQEYTDRYHAFRLEAAREFQMIFYNELRERSWNAQVLWNLCKCIYFLFALTLISINARAQSPLQTLVQDDKFWHHQTSAMLTGTGSIISFKIWEAPVRNVTFTIGSNIALGAGKEVWDGMGHGVMDWKGDFPMDIVGSFTGGFFAGMAIRLKHHRQDVIDEAIYIKKRKEQGY